MAFVHAPSAREHKAALRQQALACRKALDKGQVGRAGQAILQKVAGLEEYRTARLIHTYASSRDHEVDTLGLIRLSLEQGKDVAVPVLRAGRPAAGRPGELDLVQVGDRFLEHALLHSLEDLRQGQWNLLEPHPGHLHWLEDLGRIDLVVVPGIAFDRQGHRLGFGLGFYDRFLCRVQAPKVGLTYDSLLLERIPAEPHDVPMDVVVSESAIHRILPEEP